MAGDEGLAAEYIKAHASRVGEIMTRNVITAAPDTPLHRIAEMLEKYGIKRLPIVRDCQLVGIVSRANLVQAIATSGSKLDIPLTHLSESKLGAHGASQCHGRWWSGRFVGIRRVRHGKKLFVSPPKQRRACEP
jgi:CBS domain